MLRNTQGDKLSNFLTRKKGTMKCFWLFSYEGVEQLSWNLAVVFLIVLASTSDLKNWVVMDRSLIINLSPYLADTNKRIKVLTIKSEIMIEDKRYLAPRSTLIWGIVIWQVFLKLMPRSLFIHEKGQLMTQCQTPVKHAQKFVKIVI